MSTRSKFGEGSSTTKEDLKEYDKISMVSEINRMTFEPARYSIDQSMSLDSKVIRYKIRTICKPIYKDELVKNLTMEMCYEATSINPNSIYIPIKVCFQ